MRSESTFSSGSFFIQKGLDLCSVYVCKSLHQLIFYPEDAKRKLADILKIEAVILPSFFVFLGHSYVQHPNVEYLRYGKLRYHVYIFPRTTALHDSIIYDYSWSIGKPTEGNCNSAQQAGTSTADDEVVFIEEITKAKFCTLDKINCDKVPCNVRRYFSIIQFTELQALRWWSNQVLF